MQHDLFSSLDSFLSVPAGSGGLLIRDVTGQYRQAEDDEVLLAAQRLLAAQVRGSVDSFPKLGHFGTRSR